LEKYGKDKNNEPNQEPPLLYADGAEYLEINKGAVAFYKLIQTMGFEGFNGYLAEWVNGNLDNPTLFNDFCQKAVTHIKSSEKREIRALFETNEPYTNNTTNSN
jgi:hypothetical protein|tara:strand:- start:164 stop:475 length:312 start_codon:yes stop_codon:yes gene_type:complete